MESIDKYIVKINTEGGSASGFVVYSEGTAQNGYLITARHVVIDDKSGKLIGPIQMIAGSTDSDAITLSEIDLVVAGKSNDTEDFAVFRFERSKLPVFAEDDYCLELILLTGKETTCCVKGFPKAVNNEVLRELNEVAILRDKEDDFQVQLQIADPLVEQYNADDLLEGYSGSPLYILVEGIYYIFGIFLGYERLMRRGRGIELLGIEKALVSSGLAELGLKTIETDPMILSDILKIRSNTRRVLGRINDRIGGRIHFPRNVEKERLREHFMMRNFSLISGDAGVGKSSLVKGIFIDLNGDFEVVAFQGEQLDKSNIDEIFKAPAFELGNGFDVLLNSPGLKPEKIILLDSVEKLLETDNAATIIDFLNLLEKQDSLKVVVTCRSYAIEQLRIRFLQRLGKFEPFWVSPLSDDELDQVKTDFPSLQVLLAKPSLKRILRIPFNIDKAVSIRSEVLESEVTTEVEFRNVVWEYIIENREKESDAEIRKARGEVFESIAVDRAFQMLPYVAAREDTNINLLAELIRDNLIDEYGGINRRYAVSHDIYEDWALIRSIDRTYYDQVVQGGSIEQFLLSIGFTHAIRRAFRIWVLERLASLDSNSQGIIREIVAAENIHQYWKDEVIVAVMQSEYSEQFLQANRELIFKDNFSLYNRCLLLLGVACRTPVGDQGTSPEKPDTFLIYAGVTLAPTGRAWRNMVEFTWMNIEALRGQFQFIISFLRSWSEMLKYNEPLPSESRSAALIILNYLNFYYKQIDDQEETGSLYSEIIIVLFRLTAVVKDEVFGFLKEALSKGQDKEHYKREQIDRKLLSYAISPWDGPNICKELPDLVLEIAEKKWFFYPPTQQELDVIFSRTPFKSMRRSVDIEEQFGVKDRSYFPASAYQTPIFGMLYHSYHKAMPFLVRLFNHSAEQYWASDFLQDAPEGLRAEPRTVVEYTLPDGRKVSQFGSMALWAMYRGIHVATPYLLQSVLMALEAWMMSLAKIVDQDTENKRPDIRARLEDAVDFLLSESKSVATTAVVVGVALAYKRALANKILPILSVKDFYKWDFVRASKEHSALEPRGDGERGRVMQQERYKSNHLPHRKKYLEQLVLELSFGDYSKDILKLIDGFYQEDSQDTDWKFILNRIDPRKLKVVGQAEDGLLVQAEIDEDLKPLAHEAAKTVERVAPLSEALHWSLRMLEQKESNTDLDTWRGHFYYVSAAGERKERGALENQPAVLAAVGVFYYYLLLSNEERTWCETQVFSAVEHFLNPHNDPTGLGLSFGAFEEESAFVGLVALCEKATGDVQLSARRFLFLSLVLLQQQYEKKKLTKNARERLGSGEADFLYSCVAGLVAYRDIAGLRIEIMRKQAYLNQKIEVDNQIQNRGSRWLKILSAIQKFRAKKRAPTQKEVNLLKASFERRADGILDKVLGLSIKLNEFTGGGNSAADYYSFEAFFLIPATTSNDDLRAYIAAIAKYVTKSLDAEDNSGHNKIHHETLRSFEVHFVRFLFAQPEKVAMSNFKSVIDGSGLMVDITRKTSEFVSNFLEEIISQTRDNLAHVSRFWLFLEHLKQSVLRTELNPFGEVLFLKYSYWSSEEKRCWAGLNGKVSFFEDLASAVGGLLPLARLVSTIGYCELMPTGLLWVGRLLKENQELEKLELTYLELLSSRLFYDKEQRSVIRLKADFRSAYIKILDVLITNGSATAFLIREDFIAMSR